MAWHKVFLRNLASSLKTRLSKSSFLCWSLPRARSKDCNPFLKPAWYGFWTNRMGYGRKFYSLFLTRKFCSSIIYNSQLICLLIIWGSWIKAADTLHGNSLCVTDFVRFSFRILYNQFYLILKWRWISMSAVEKAFFNQVMNILLRYPNDKPFQLIFLWIHSPIGSFPHFRNTYSLNVTQS